MSILDNIGEKFLREYLEKCSVYVKIDIDFAIELTKQFIKKHRGENVPYEKIKYNYFTID